MNLKVKKLHKDAVIPKKAHDADAGFDMVAVSKKETPEYIQYGTGLAFEIPYGYVGLLFSRSSVTKMDLMLKNSVGVVDSGYLGEVSFRFYKVIVEEANRSSQVYDTFNGHLIENNHKVLNYKLESNQKIYDIGERIGQIMFIELPKIELCECEELSESERGEGGYGSTGK